jgi:hypothetical protein
MKTETLCSGCQTAIDTENEMYWPSHRTDDVFCENCRINDMGYASTIMLFGPDFPPTSNGPHRVLVTDHFVEDQWGEEFNDLEVEHRYVHTSAWRGYQETKIVGWTEMVDGWTTGMPDDTVARKIDFNEWVEDLAEEQIIPPVNLAVIMDQTSNVFSMAIGVHVPAEQVEDFTTWINGELSNLRYALS